MFGAVSMPKKASESRLLDISRLLWNFLWRWSKIKVNMREERHQPQFQPLETTPKKGVFEDMDTYLRRVSASEDKKLHEIYRDRIRTAKQAKKLRRPKPTQ